MYITLHFVTLQQHTLIHDFVVFRQVIKIYLDLSLPFSQLSTIKQSVFRFAFYRVSKKFNFILILLSFVFCHVAK